MTWITPSTSASAAGVGAAATATPACWSSNNVSKQPMGKFRVCTHLGWVALARAVALLKPAVHRMRVPRDLKIAMVVARMYGRIADVVLVSEGHDSQASQHHHQNGGGGGSLHRRGWCSCRRGVQKARWGRTRKDRAPTTTVNVRVLLLCATAGSDTEMDVESNNVTERASTTSANRMSPGASANRPADQSKHGRSPCCLKWGLSLFWLRASRVERHGGLIAPGRTSG